MSFIKSPIKTPPKKTMSEWASSLMNENFLNKPSDLAKLLLVLKNGIHANDWPQEVNDLRQFVVDRVKQCFDDSGEAATETCFETALEYGFIRIETDAKTGLKRYVETAKSQLDIRHDWFCFDCDVMVSKTNRQFIKCDKCLRVFHRKCCQEFDTVKEYVCRHCKAVEEVESNSYINNQKIDAKRMSRLIGFLLDFAKRQMKKKFEEIDLKFESQENTYIYVFKEMNLSLMRQKVDKNEYNSLAQFNDDFLIYMHNLFISQIDFVNSNISQNFEDLRTFLNKELIELKKCVDCYERANDKALHQSNKEWFCLPCVPPHKPVFAKLKNCPFWPAKVIRYFEDNKTSKIEVCFFEAEKVKSKASDPTFKKSDVKPLDIRDIDDVSVLNQIKNNQRLVKPMELLVKYLELVSDSPSQCYSTTIDLIRQNNLTHKTTNKDQSIDECIESTIRSALKTPSKVPSKGRRKSKQSNPTPKVTPQIVGQPSEEPSEEIPITWQPKSRKKKMKSNSSSKTSTRSSSPNSKIPVLPNMLTNDSNDSIDFLSNTVPDLTISEPPDISQDMPQDSHKRRSGRIAQIAQITPQKTDFNKKSEIKSVKTSKRRNKSLDESRQMEVGFKHQSKTNKESVLATDLSERSHSALNQQNIGNNQNTSETNTQSSEAIHSNTSQQLSQSCKQTESNVENNSTKVQYFNIQTKGVTTAVVTTASSVTPIVTLTTPSMTSQSIADPITAVPVIVPLVIDLASNPTELRSEPLKAMENSSFGKTVSEKVTNIQEIADRLNHRMQELIDMKDLPHSKMELDEKLAVIEFHQKQLVEKLKTCQKELEQVKIEVRDIKRERWCCMCEKRAKCYCCIRYYCSRQCQALDWKTGHSTQCLDLKK